MIQPTRPPSDPRFSQALFLLFIIFLAVTCLPAPAHARHHKAPAHHGGGLVDRGASYADIVIDAASGEILHASNPDALRHPASLSKMMTLYVVFEALESGRLRLDQYLPISVNASEQSPSKLGLRPGQRIMVEDAILGLVTESANDAAMVLAEGLGGSAEGFGVMMTKQAQALGMTSSHFNNPSGLPDPEQITTARDMAVLGHALIYHFPEFYPYFSHDSFTYAGIYHHNHNHLMDRYDGMDGIKTGYIRASGFNLVASAKHGNLRLIGVVFGGKSATARDNHMAQLLDISFARAQAEKTGGRPAGVAAAAAMAAADEGQGAQGDSDDGSEVSGYVALPPKVAAIFPRGSAPPRDVSPSLGVSAIPAASLPNPPPAPVSAQPAAPPQQIAQPAPPLPPAAPAMPQASAMPPQPQPQSQSQPQPMQLALNTQNAAAVASAAALAAAQHPRNWGIQIGAYSNPDIARQALANLVNSQPQALAQADPQVQKIGLIDNPMFRARLMAMDQPTAQRLCAYMIQHGQSCLTVGP